MTAILGYLLLLTLIWASGLIIYFTLLRSVPAHAFNRGFLLTTLLGGLIIPLLPTWGATSDLLPSATALQSVWLPGITVTGNGVVEEASSYSMATILILLGYCMSIAILMKELWGILKLHAESRLVDSIQGMSIRDVDAEISPSSFFGNLYIHGWAALSSERKILVSAHELKHFKKLHSVDVLLVNLAVAVFWFHPLSYLLRRELRLVHEFQADAELLSEFSRKRYQQALLQEQFGTPASVFAASFAQSPLKLRFLMMNNSFRKNMLWRLCCAMLLGLVVFAACTKEEIDETELANLVASNEDGDLLSAADAADVTGMVVTAVDTVLTFDPESKQAIKQIVTHYKDPNSSKTKSIVKSLAEANGLNNGNSTGAEQFRSQPVYKVVDEMPRFTDCVDDEPTKPMSTCATKALLEYVYENIKYPSSAREAGIEGTSVISFIVGTDGEVLDQRIERNPAAGINEQAANDIAMELLSLTADMPAWIPGKQNGQDVQVRFNLPVKFKLQ